MYKVSNIKALVKATLTNDKKKVIYCDIAKPRKRIKKKIEKILSIDLSEYFHYADNYAIKHILLQHGNSTTEMKRGQVAITLDTFFKIPEIIKKPDRIVESFGRNKKLKYITYIKKYKNEIYYVEEIRTGKKRLALKTMYIKKTAKK